MLPRLRHLVSACFPFLVLGLPSCLTIAGCASMDQQTEVGNPDPDAQLGAQMRKPTAPGQLLGIDERAREIERHLGVR
jgi:hypothetical protein